jgi:hypothetical protein
MATPATGAQLPLPNPTTLLQAAKIAIENDMPIQLDYYVDSTCGKAFMGEDSSAPKDKADRFLMKGLDEYTSSVKKAFRVGDDFIILTLHSIYIVSVKMQLKRIPKESLLPGDDE